MKPTHMNIRMNIMLAYIIFIGFLSFVQCAEAAVTLVNGQWSTTFNCADWTQNTGGLTTICDGVINSNYLNSCNGQVSHADATANNPSGGGGKGFRQYICSGSDAQTGSPRITLSSSVPELWFRWYMRYPSGFSWSPMNYHKIAYSDNLDWVIDLVWGNSVSLYDLLHSRWHYPDHSACDLGTPILSGTGWSKFADGNWHYLEFHLKTDTNGSNGVYQQWVDGVLENSHTDVNYGGHTFNSWSMLINQENVSVAGWVDLDDMAISTTGYIGPVSGGGGGDTTAPTLTMTSPTNNPTYSTSSSTVAVSGTASDNVAVSSVKWACPTCIPTSGTATGTTSWSVPPISLSSGSNVITVTATDSNNNTSSKTLSVTSTTTSVVNGACGTASGQSFPSLTSSSPNLCATGTVASFTGTGPWTWGCNGSGGGASTAGNACSATLSTATLLFSEDFEDTNFTTRGWYDGGMFGITTAEHESGTHAASFTFAQGATSSAEMSAGAARKQFTATDTLYVSFYIKFATGWQGSQKAYHPHMISILSDADDTFSAYSPIANNYLNTYIEFLSDIGSPYTIRPQLDLQDEKNVNTGNGTPPNDLTAVTENRSVNFCNTPVSPGATGQCYADITYYSANVWKAPTASISTNAWHHVEAYFKMNSISGGKGQKDGIMQESIDGTQVINRSDVLYRTNQHPALKWRQFVVAPYIGDGAPVAEKFYIDNLVVYNGLPSGSSIKPVSGVSVKSVTSP